MYQDQQGLPRQCYKEQCKEGEEGVDKRSVENNKISEWTGLKFCNALREAKLLFLLPFIIIILGPQT